MQSGAKTVEEYLAEIPADRRESFCELRQLVVENIPSGFEEIMSYGMIGYVVPHSLYPKGYHCNTSLPLPFINLASQKHFIGFYHMGIYAMPELLDWFVSEYPSHSKRRLDMGKSCIRFKDFNNLPLELIAQLVAKVSVEGWIAQYQSSIN
jgi:uncharacterized protein YdhG (YjbR/CyaY superfamily)